jgi:hypothetical protein
VPINPPRRSTNRAVLPRPPSRLPRAAATPNTVHTCHASLPTQFPCGAVAAGHELGGLTHSPWLAPRADVLPPDSAYDPLPIRVAASLGCSDIFYQYVSDAIMVVIVLLLMYDPVHASQRRFDMVDAERKSWGVNALQNFHLMVYAKQNFLILVLLEKSITAVSNIVFTGKYFHFNWIFCLPTKLMQNSLKEKKNQNIYLY